MPTDPAAIASFLAPKPVGILWGIGKKTSETLRPYGIVTCEHLQRIPSEQLATILGSREAAMSLRNHAFGIADDTVRWESASEQSVSREHTFKTDECDREKVRATLLELVADVGRRFRTEKRWARTVRIKLRDAAFNTITRQTSLDLPARDDVSFREKALELFDRERFGAIRLVGFGVTNLQDTPEANGPSLFARPEDVRREKRERLSAALDALRDKGLI